MRGRQKVHQTSNGYKRVYDDGKTDYFDKEGNLIKVVGKNYFFNLNYKKDRLDSIKDSEGKQIFFAWNENGFIKSVWSGKKKATYAYDGKKLKKSVDAAKNTYQYDYDSNYNMTQITYQDGSKMKIDYEPKTQFVQRVAGRDGLVSEYKYDANPKKPDHHYWTTVSKKAIGGKSKPTVNRYEYEIKNRKDGSEYTYRVVTDVNGLKTETTYSECCSLPLMIKKGKDVTRFEYENGLITKKTSSNGTFVNISYDKKCGKINEVKNNEGWTTFKYNKQCRISVAKNSKGESFLLTYELKGNLANVVYRDKDNKKKVVNFKYNSLGKTEKIIMKGVGEVSVLYDDKTGKVKNVRSAKGVEVADKVTRTFLSLLSVVRPAGVNLSSI